MFELLPVVQRTNLAIAHRQASRQRPQSDALGTKPLRPRRDAALYCCRKKFDAWKVDHLNWAVMSWSEKMGMDERRHFASLILASRLGLISKQELIAQADRRLLEVDEPENWLIELSWNGDSADLAPLIVNADDEVYTVALRMAFDAWTSGSIDDRRLAECCSTLWKQAGETSRWYSDLVWIDDEFDLVEQGVFDREDSVKKVRAFLEKYLQN